MRCIHKELYCLTLTLSCLIDGLLDCMVDSHREQLCVYHKIYCDMHYTTLAEAALSLG